MASQEIILEPMEEKETISCLIHCTFGLTENQIVTWRLGFNRVIAAICRYQLLSSLHAQEKAIIQLNHDHIQICINEHKSTNDIMYILIPQQIKVPGSDSYC